MIHFFKNNADQAQKEKSAIAERIDVSNVANFTGDVTVDLNDQGDAADFSVDVQRQHLRIFANAEEDVTKRLQSALNDGFKINKITTVVQAIVNTFLSALNAFRAFTGNQTAEFNVLIKGSVVRVIFPVVPGQALQAKDATVLIKNGVSEEDFIAMKNQDAAVLDKTAEPKEAKKSTTAKK